MVLSSEDGVYAWGFANNGKLGIGAQHREQVEAPYNRYFPMPNYIGGLSKVKVLQISCGPNHSLALAPEGIYSWGSGDGGRLGHGHDEDCTVPKYIDALKDHIVLQISAGYWHSAAVILIPPLRQGGWVSEI